MKPTVASVFVGCKISQADGEQALSEMTSAGMRAAERHDAADVVVVHTCCVTAEAERKSRRLVRRYERLGRRVIVAGCAARLRPAQFAGAGVEIVDGRDWAALAAEASVPGVEPAASPVSLAAERHVSPAEGEGAAAADFSAVAGRRTRFVLKVQDGCAGQCAYCVVRLVRGAPRSTPLAHALAAARTGLERGCGEVVLSGIDLGAWTNGEARLPQLIEAACGLPGLRRLRLSSLEPRHVDERLLAALAHERVARHLHLPLQSGDDAVLAAMRRPYTVGEFLATAQLARDRLGDVMLSTDVIVGFPTEDEAAFARTLRLLDGGLFGRVHVFAFSPRPGTAAAGLPPLPALLVKERMARALAAAARAAREARTAALGRPAHVLLEERHEGFWRGYSSEYIPYYLEGRARRGELVRAVAQREHKDGVAGLLEEANE